MDVHVDGFKVSLTRPKGEKIPHLDGLRGYSILTVIVLHSGYQFPRWLSSLGLLFGNGTFGVDIFFVISGFLITTLLLQESDRTGSISLPDFYRRRIARIFPAAYTYVGVIALLNLVGILHVSWRGFIPASLFCWNYGALLNIPHDRSAIPVLNHFWSLSLEEQFYLLWPSCLVFMTRKNARLLAWIVVATVPFVRLGGYWLFPSWRPALGWMFHTAVDMIFWGALLAFAYADGAHLRWAKKPWLGWVTLAYGFVAIFGVEIVGSFIPGVARFVEPTVYTSFAALLLLWLLSGSKGIVRGILNWRLLRWVGVISYSLYIWQQIFLHRDSPLRAPRPFNIAFALFAACTSYYLIESPLRKKLREALIRHPGRDKKTSVAQA